MAKNKEIIPSMKAWNYEESVAASKPLVALYNKVSLDLVRELYAAREALSNPGYRADLTSADLVTNVTRLHTFKDYLEEIGINKMTANRWLALYSPQEDKLYTREELEEKFEALFLTIRKKRLKQFGWAPEGWTESNERKYQTWLKMQDTQKSLEEKGYEQAELFSREYFNLLARQMQDDPTPAEILHFNDLCETYSGRVTSVVKVEDQMTIVQVVEKALSLFDADKRPEIGRSIAKVIDDLSLQMEV
ncbi:hypothetical protein [uncultured Sphaerochaeta sp.]|uniref:hypothetical protein n=1 Tax=uncultured Sphaerochaeta sp. TaxID=886478 RepID=UPI002A0A130A|nr:hypothetical protein [uncultured Sphaerochaeta sp.]